MADLDEEGEILPYCVSRYDFVDQNDVPISFSVLPLQWNEGDDLGNLEMKVFIHGTTDDGLQKVYKQVIAWKFELSYAQPEISVLSKEKYWILIQNPRRSFKNIIRTILITVHFLHFMKKNPEASGNSIWAHLSEIFRSYEVGPAERDLLDHMPLIIEAANKDKDLHNSVYMLSFMQKPQTNVGFHEGVQKTKKCEFIVPWGEDEDSGSKEYNEKEESFAVCAICDDGGDVLFCDGRCLRAFHAIIAAGIASSCKSLGYTKAQVDGVSTFLCQNCQYHRHQCFACGVLGSSDRSSQQEVFPCVSATCGHFYHPECVANLLHPDSGPLAEELQKRITAGESFTCPVHKCFVCNRSEDKNVFDLQFAMCRRCPKANHRKCLPREIAFSKEMSFQRAWERLLPNNRILIYCLEHKIIRDLETPARNHLIFPGVEGNREKKASELLPPKENVVSLKRNLVSESPRPVKKTTKVVAECGVDLGVSTTKIEEGCIRQKSLKTAEKSKSSLRKDSLLVKSRSYMSSKKNSIVVKPTMKKVNSSKHLIDVDGENKILALIKDSTSSFNKEEFMKQRIAPATYACGSKNVLDKTITLGFVEGSVKAVRTALQKLEEGCSIEDAKTVCEPEIIYKIFHWKRKLDVYLAPFLHGMCYTSFGRHFTKREKLEEIVDRLCWYVCSGDTIVDFCCGSNDFSFLMKEKLEKMGKLCSFRNFDLFQPKNDFSFEKRDWMTVNPEELPDGSQLIMGLNPPFGYKASLANKFINKALKFNPKLIILIVPKETRRLDEKASYNLIWEDNEVLSGKSFYLPGSIDVHDNQLEQWNLNPPLLSLWSRCDWTARHNKIAQEHGHISAHDMMDGGHW